MSWRSKLCMLYWQPKTRPRKLGVARAAEIEHQREHGRITAWGGPVD